MIGRRQLGIMHNRLCQVFPTHRSEPFAGVSLILIADFAQLPPVEDTPLYMLDSKRVLSNLGREMYTHYSIPQSC